MKREDKVSPVISIGHPVDFNPYVSEIEKLYSYNLPHHLYHYCGQEAVLGILSSQQIRFSDVQYLNDKSEYKYGVDLVLDNIKKLQSDDNNDRQHTFLSLLYDTYQRPLSKTIFVACFCETENVLSQWERYAHKSTGYSLGFKFTENLLLGFGDDKACRAWILKVIYQQVEQNQIIRSSLKGLLKYLESPNSNPNTCINYFINTVDSWLYAFKDSFFKEEKEWRILINLISMGSSVNYSNVHFRSSPLGLVPYVNIRPIEGGVNHESKLPLSEVWLGPKTNETDKKSIEMMIWKNQLPEVEVKYSTRYLR
jgi:Protein of unknown function (DUF2971)